MTDTKVDLGDFEGLEVIATTIAIRNTGDGLSKAMEVDPQVLHQNDTVYVVMECKVTDVAHPTVKDAETKVTRKHVLKAGNATIVDGKLVRVALNEIADKIQKARDEATKAQALDLDYNPLGVGEDGSKTAGPANGAAARTGAKKAPAKRPPAKKTAKKSRALASVKVEE